MPSHLHLFPIDAHLARALDAGPAEFRLRYRADAADPALVRAVVDAALAMPPAPAPWGGYLAVDEATRVVVGTCSFRAAPVDGAVELAYFTFPGCEGRGCATAMAARLLEIAWTVAGVRAAVAHTPPGESASTRILRKLGFRLRGVVADPRDGPVWRWERVRPGMAALREPPLPG